MSSLLNYTELNSDSKSNPILILHGLFGSSQNWLGFAKNFAKKNFRVVIVDLRNHGNSFHHDVHDYQSMVLDLVPLITILGKPVNVVGHSMGGKVAMLLSAWYPEYIEKLAVIDIAPVKYDHPHLEIIDILLQIDLSKLGKRSEVDQMLANRIPDSKQRAFLLLNLIREQQSLRWKINLNALKKYISNIMDFPASEFSFSKPALFVSGINSGYIGQKHLSKINGFFPNSNLEIVPNSGHWVHVDNPVKLLSILNHFFSN